MCALANGVIDCWGNYSLAKFNPDCCGITSFVNKQIIRMAAGSMQTCAIKTNAVWCWGKNDVGQLGDGTINSNPQSASLVRFSNYSLFR
jgi:alpha-tubulin suppressor-like RCC1 family protein